MPGNFTRIYRSPIKYDHFNQRRNFVASILFIVTCSVLCNTAVAKVDNFRTRLNQAQNTSWSESDVVMEIKFGQEIAARILSKYKLLSDAKLTRYVSLVGTSIALHSQRSELDFHFAILDNKSLNAYSTPGGYIFITKGLLDIVDDEAELASILAHEIAHISQRHIVSEFNIKGSSREELSTLARFIGASASTTNAAFSQAIDKVMTVLFDSGFEKTEELQADNAAILLLAATGYDPSALLRVITRIKQTAGNRLNSITHPTFSNRFNNMSALLKKEKLLSRSFTTAKTRFIANVNGYTSKGILYNAASRK